MSDDDERNTTEGGEDRETQTSTETTSQEDQALKEVEDKARAAGWKPESEYTGPKGGYVSAQMFLDRGDLYDQIKAQKNAIKRMEKTVNTMASGFKSQVKAQVALRIKELTEDRKAAIIAGDVQAVEQLDVEIETEKQTAKAEIDETPDEVAGWIAENKWFTEDTDLKAFAIAHNKEYVKLHPGASISDSLAKTAEAVKRAHPEKFAPPPKPKTPPSPVEGTVEPKGAKDGKKYNVSRLSPDQKLVYEQMVKRHQILTHEDYFKGLEEIGELA